MVPQVLMAILAIGIFRMLLRLRECLGTLNLLTRTLVGGISLCQQYKEMFKNADTFNQDIGGWDISLVNSILRFFNVS